MLYQNVSRASLKDILDYLGCPPKAPTLRYLNQLIHAHIRKVPWESVSRIVKRHTTLETKDCPRWPEVFWQDAIRYGLGGTCFESGLSCGNRSIVRWAKISNGGSHVKQYTPIY